MLSFEGLERQVFRLSSRRMGVLVHVCRRRNGCPSITNMPGHTAGAVTTEEDEFALCCDRDVRESAFSEAETMFLLQKQSEEPVPAENYYHVSSNLVIKLITFYVNFTREYLLNIPRIS